MAVSWIGCPGQVAFPPRPGGNIGDRVPLLVLAFLAFVGLGLPAPLPGTLWPELRPQYALPQAALGLVLGAKAVGYLAANILTGRAMQAIGIGVLLAAAMALTAVATLGQALAPPWGVFVALAVLGGIGSGAVDAVLNTYAALRFAPRHLNWLHACWGLGATLGPGLATVLLAAGAGWQAGYAAVAAILVAIAITFGAMRARWASTGTQAGAPPLPALSALRQPMVRHQILVFFLLAGVEVSTGQWAATVLVERGATPATAAAAATLFWAMMALGRVAMGLVVDRIGADRLVRIAAPLAALAAIGFAVAPRGADLVALALLAVAFSPLFPTLVARTPARLGAATALHAVGFQVAAATLGAAVLPGVIGVAVGQFGAGAAPMLVAALTAVLAVLVRRLG
jgi:fucose permease